MLVRKGLTFPSEPLRKNLVWTKKIIAISLLSAIFIFILTFYLTGVVHRFFYNYSLAAATAFVGLLIIFSCLFFIFASLAVILLKPLDFLVKRWLIERAKHKIKELKHLKIVGIAGSFGKTTMKEVLLRVLGARFAVFATPESINTPVGVARWILKNVNESAQIIIVEMGEHYKGDIAELCKITPPDVAVVIGINEAHLERLKDLKTTALTIFEIVDNLKPDGLLLINSDNIYAKEYYESMVEKYVKQGEKRIQMAYFSCEKEVAAVQFNPYEFCWTFNCLGIHNCCIFLLGEYAIGMAVAGIKLGQHFNMHNAEIKEGLLRVRPVEHRLQPIRRPANILVIDDAYNGNSEGTREAIKILSRFEGRRKIYITPGLVETGMLAREVHLEIGRQLASVVDVVILIENSVTGWIEEGIKSKNTRTGKPKILWFQTATQAHIELQKILLPGDVALFQNDWGDQYI